MVWRLFLKLELSNTSGETIVGSFGFSFKFSNESQPEKTMAVTAKRLT